MDFELRYLREAVIENSGTLGILDSPEMPFRPQRLYWIHSVPLGSTRGNHAHKRLKQFFWLARGTVSIELSNGSETVDIPMSENRELLVVSPGLWRKLHKFSENAVVVVGADKSYDSQDYIHDWQEFMEWKKNLNEI
jgi:dTDP-4-dehydrorhamnose 3,5-epimerase-like enzyme